MPKIDTTVRELVDMIDRGELRLPELQRRYVWPATRVRDLLDSLYRGYPSGAILVWETTEDIPSRDLAIEQRMSVFGSHKLLLDGQQRLTSLTAVLRGEPLKFKNRVRPVEIAFNLDHPEGPPTEVTEVDDDEPLTDLAVDEDPDVNGDGRSVQERVQNRTFVVASRALLSDPRWVKVSDIFNPKVREWDLLKRLVDSPDDPRYERYSQRLQGVKKIGDYQYVMHVLERDLSYEEVAEIFVRVNSLGMKLRGSDLAMAQITARWPGALDKFEEFAEECEKVWFTFDPGLLVRTLVVFATGQSRFRTVTSISVPRMEDSWEKAKDGLRFAVNFLRANAGIEDESLRGHLDSVADPAAVLVVRVEKAYSHLGLADDGPGRLATARAGAALVESLRRASSRVRLVESLAQADLPATDTAVANSLSRAEAVATNIDSFRWDRLAPLRAAEGQGQEHGRTAASTLRTLREAVTADEFATRLEPVLSRTDDAIFDWLSAGQPVLPVEPPPARRPDDVPIQVPPPPLHGRTGQATRRKGGPASEVLGPLTAFLDAHRDEQVVVEWRVQE